jgi:hypothetical protein
VSRETGRGCRLMMIWDRDGEDREPTNGEIECVTWRCGHCISYPIVSYKLTEMLFFFNLKGSLSEEEMKQFESMNLNIYSTVYLF